MDIASLNQRLSEIALSQGMLAKREVDLCLERASSQQRSFLEVARELGVLTPRRQRFLTQLSHSLPPSESQAPSWPTVSLEVGQSVDGYQLIRELGRGGMGAVFLAEKGGVPYALKFVLGDADLEQRERFDREARAMASVDRHPNIAKIHVFGRFQNKPYFVLDFIDGEDLQKRIDREGPIPNEQALTWALKLAKALDSIHRKGILHRDLKPANILIRHVDSEPFISDFGLAWGQEFEDLTMTGGSLGTPAFMAPEQFDPGGHFGEISQKSDLWGLGVIFYVMLTAQLPYSQESPIDIYLAMMRPQSFIPSPIELNPNADSILNQVTVECLQRQQKLRLDLSTLISRLENPKNTPSASTPKKARSFLPLFLFVLVLAGLASFWFLRSAPVFECRALGLRRYEGVDWVREQTLKISGSTGEEEVLVRARSQSGLNQVLSDAQGKFQLEFQLKPGLNTIVLVSQGLRKKFTVRADFDAPMLTLSQSQSYFRASEELTLTGRVKESNLQSLRCNESIVKVDSNGSFRIRRPSSQNSESITLIARDKAGHQSQVKIQRMNDDLWREHSVSALQDLKQWQALTLPDKKAIALFVEEKLQGQFSFVSINSFQCGLLSFDIASFLHTKSQVLFHLIPGGTFSMGSLSIKAEQDYLKTISSFKQSGYRISELEREVPSRTVNVTPFLMGRAELSTLEWKRSPEVSLTGTNRNLALPMGSLNFRMAQAWIDSWSCGLRLPSEAEWEYAARGGSEHRFFFGPQFDPSYVWYSGNAGKSVHSSERHIKTKKWNAFGLVDTLGNQLEFVGDKWHPNYQGAPSHSQIWEKPSADDDVVLRGGNYYAHITRMRVTYRWRTTQTNGEGSHGLRLAHSLTGFPWGP